MIEVESDSSKSQNEDSDNKMGHSTNQTDILPMYQQVYPDGKTDLVTSSTKDLMIKN